MSDHGNMDTSPDSEEDTASGGPSEQATEPIAELTGETDHDEHPQTTDEDGTLVENPSG